jgi:transcriptional regulator with PAS, ATPase and Fis domain
MAGGSSPRRLSLGRWFERSLRPVYVLDEKRSIVFANEACLRWLGAPAQRVLGQRVDYHSMTVPAESEKDAVGFLSGLCPPPEILESGRGTIAAWCVSSEGALRHRAAQVFAMSQEGTARRHLLVLLEEQDQEASGHVDPRESSSAGLRDRLHERLLALHRRLLEPYRLESLLGLSPAMQRVRRQVGMAAETRVNVLVTGEPGCGREQVARTIHRLRTADCAATLIPLDCRILDAELLESTVLSVLRSGAQLKQAEPATLLLLDVDQLERTAQSVLRVVLERSEFPLRTFATASQETSHSSSSSLDEALRCVLATVEIQLPPLRERLDDLPMLLQAAMESLNAQGGRQVAGFTAEAIDALQGHPWRRNLDELREVVTEAWRRAEDSRIGREDLPAIIGWTADAEDYPVVPPEMASLDDYLAAIERELVVRAVARAQGNRAEAARLLGIPRSRLLRKLEPMPPCAGKNDSTDQDGPATPDEEASA